MSKKVILITSGIILLAFALGGGFLFRRHVSAPSSPVPVADETQKYTRIDIQLKDGGLAAAAPSTYLVKKGTNLEFHITSNKFGKISVPTQPAKTITFTESPLIFKFSPPDKLGSYALTYQPENSKNVILIGTIVIRP